MILVYCSDPSQRLRYALTLLFEHVVVARYQLIVDRAAFESTPGFKINYSNEAVEANIHWPPHPVLTSDEIFPVEISVTQWQNMPVFFQCDDAHWPFDLLAASFYLASRWEEYLPFEKDRHDRFGAEQSLAAQHDFLQRPLINDWVNSFFKWVQTVHPEIQTKKRDFSAEMTYDIDVNWAYLHKGLYRTTGATILDVLKGQWQKLRERMAVLSGRMNDPYDTYNYILSTLKSHHLPGRMFFLLGDYSQFDRNTSHENAALRKLIQSIETQLPIGIHPSYGSRESRSQVHKEIKRLEKIVGREIHDSRQHYLRLWFPETYRRLIALGVQRDYTMGYAQQAGFRASLCTPFPFFDLEQNAPTALTIYPFAYMDGTLLHYMKLDPELAKHNIQQLIDAVRQVNGHFMCLWHNSSLSETNEWKGWREVYEFTLKSCAVHQRH